MTKGRKIFYALGAALFYKTAKKSTRGFFSYLQGKKKPPLLKTTHAARLFFLRQESTVDELANQVAF